MCRVRMAFISVLLLCSIWTMISQQPNSVHSFTIGSRSIPLCYQNHNAFTIPTTQSQHPHIFGTLLFSSFTADGSEYAAGDSDFDNDDDYDDANVAAMLRNNNGDDEQQPLEDEDDENRFVPTIELQPVPISKNAGNRFITVVWDRTIKNRERFVNKNEIENDNDLKQWNDHYDRIQYTEDHVLFCRKQNLYNDTFNNHSMVDILWSLPILSSDLQRVIGHAMCLESTELHYVQDVLRNDPIVRMLLLGHPTTNEADTRNNRDGAIKSNTNEEAPLDISSIPIYRWRHIRDYSLRIDDGRDGYPCMCLALDDKSSDLTEIQQLRQETQKEYLETLIRSERVIAAGPLHVPTITKDDPLSIPIGDFILFNAKDRHDAVSFCENLPTAMVGLYDNMRVHFYNTLDISGKFVSEDPLRDAPCEEMKEAMEYWGYPVADEQTPWINR